MPVWERSMRKLVSQVSANGDIAYAMCQGGVLRSTIEALGPGRLDETTEAKAIVARFGERPIEAPNQALLVTAGCSSFRNQDFWKDR
jgi:hypothetical protein